jgi:hypothetical protein
MFKHVLKRFFGIVAIAVIVLAIFLINAFDEKLATARAGANGSRLDHAALRLAVE